MSDEIIPAQNADDEVETQGDDEVQAHSADQILGLQRLEKKLGMGNNNPAMSCSSCYGLSCG
ncbi:hypothetical protein [Actinocrispum sp. NPDC049592]|uniref:hypothetical protein n=1 Tax=Actinocrispum sp. NPDC049592 TaxID=3154835 RepID=UPI003447A54B